MDIILVCVMFLVYVVKVFAAGSTVDSSTINAWLPSPNIYNSIEFDVTVIKQVKLVCNTFSANFGRRLVLAISLFVQSKPSLISLHQTISIMTEIKPTI